MDTAGGTHVPPKSSETDTLEGDRSQFSTKQDESDMYRLGRSQQLKRSFRSLSILCLTSCTMITFSGILEQGNTARSASFVYINGGRAGAIYDYIAVWVCEAFVAASLAEMASMAPTSSGQYHWVSEFAPSSIQKPLSYIDGWLAALTWQTYVATPAYAAAATTLILASIANPTYEVKAWQETVLTLAIVFLVCAFNVYGARVLPAAEVVCMVLLLSSFFAAMLPLWILAPTVSASQAFGSFSNFGGWSSIGAACIVGQIAAAGSLTGVDAAVHMSEEVKDASRTVPRMIMGTILVNGITGFATQITLSFVIQNVKSQVVDSSAVYPFIDIFKVSIAGKAGAMSTAGAIGMTVLLVPLSVACSLSSMATASRQAWSFARDGGFPFFKLLTRLVVVNEVPLPVNAMLASVCISIIIALLNLAGTEVFDSVFGIGSGAASKTYLISIGSVLWRRLFGKPLPPARWSLGHLGVSINTIALLFLAQYIVLAYFPIFRQVTAGTMNWGAAMFGGMGILSLTYYLLWGHRTYRAPVLHLRQN